MMIPTELRVLAPLDGFRGFFLESRRGFRASGVVGKGSVISILRAFAKRGGNDGKPELSSEGGFCCLQRSFDPTFGICDRNSFPDILLRVSSRVVDGEGR